MDIVTGRRRLVAAAILEASRRRRKGDACRSVEVQPDGSLTWHGRGPLWEPGQPVTLAAVRGWQAAGYHLVILNRAGGPDVSRHFPEAEHIRLTRPGEA